MKNDFASLRALHDQGFALHWVKPNSKQPTDMGWSKGPRKSWADLAAVYSEGLNVGVRLGQASRVGAGYLAVIDCDMKSTLVHHLQEMERALSGLGLAPGAPCVLSGRGNGSRHIYVTTETPIQGYEAAKSGEIVRVMMPSIRVSKREHDTLTAEEIRAGWRLRSAWEISVMSEGRQVVLPPSRHPDTGKEYRWASGFEFSVGACPKFVAGKPARAATTPASSSVAFVPVEVDLFSREIPSVIFEMLTKGDGVTDRSASLLPVACALVKAGFSDQETLSVLTDGAYFLGSVGYDHVGSDNRARAAEWVRKFTLEKAKRETLAEYEFRDNATIEDASLPPDEAATQIAEIRAIEGPGDWRLGLERAENTRRLKTSLHNVGLILRNDVGPSVFRRDTFSMKDVYGLLPPWGGAVGAEITDSGVNSIVHWLVSKWRLEVPKEKVYSTVTQIAVENPFHPVREWLGALPVWDGVPRIDTWIRDYLGGDESPGYLRAISRKILVAMVARVMVPGVKFDQVLILEGAQGIGKSTAARLISDPWFSDAHMDISDKDSVLAMQAVWVMELGELSSMKKADVDQLKEFVSRKTDRIRLPYGRLTEAFDRQCVFIGTPNNDKYLIDDTGNRRFWSVKVNTCDRERLEKDRAQLFSEAKLFWELCEPLYLEDPEIEKEAKIIQSERVWEDELVDTLSLFMGSTDTVFPKTGFTIAQLFGQGGPFDGKNNTKAEQMRVGKCLRRLGYSKNTTWVGAHRRNIWRSPEK